MTRGRAVPDAELVRRVRAGDVDAFAAIHDRYRHPLERFATRFGITGATGAEDLVQDVFIRAHAALRGDNRPVELRPWLYRMTHNRCVDELRRGRGAIVGDIPPHAVAPGAGPECAAVGNEAVATLVAGVRALPDRQRSALVAHAVDGESHVRIARRLGTTPQSSKALVHRARANLARTLAA